MPEPATENILIVEDDPSLRELLRDEMQDAGYQVCCAGNAEDAITQLTHTRVQLIISDLRLPGASGLDLLHSVHQQHPTGGAIRPGFIVITAFGTVEQAVDALKQGADDFLTKPIKLEHLRISADRVIQQRKLQQELAQYRRLIGDQGFHGLLGLSEIMQQLFNSIRMVARAEGPVLVTGESGTGKELVARAIHAESTRSKAPFVAVNCAGIPPELLESELFGHTAGAFTGARSARTGLFAEADGGSLLLDEIGEMPMEMQAKLLRILQDGRIRPVGTNQEKQLDVRIIAATNRRLLEDVKAQRFREDLYFRLQTFTIEVPALRERGADIELLIAHFIQRYSLQLEREIRGISVNALDLLRKYSFPGNVRELASVIERAATFCQSGEIEVNDLPGPLLKGSIPEEQKNTDALCQQMLNRNPASDEQLPSLEEIEDAYIRHTLAHFAGNKRRAADSLGIARRTLYRRLDDRESD